MAECPNEQGDEEDIFQDCDDTFESWVKLDRSEISDITNSLGDSSRPVFPKIQNSNTETGIGDYNQNSPVPVESQKSEQQKNEENISLLAPLTGEQEGTMQDELGRTLDEPDQSESSNGENSQGDASQTESQETHSGKAETDAVDYNQNRDIPAESQQGQQDVIEPETTPYVLPQMPTEPNTVRSNDFNVLFYHYHTCMHAEHLVPSYHAV